MVRHCATRLRLIVLDKDKIQVKKIEVVYHMLLPYMHN